MSPERRLLAGWGRTAPSAARLVAVGDRDGAVAAVRQAGRRGVVGRGLGRAYNDAAQNAGGLVADATGLGAIAWHDRPAGLVRVGAGVSIDALIRWALTQGWFVPVSPGTRQVTVGGAIAADIHGKNHHRSGSWGAHTTEITLVDGEGGVRVLGPTTTPGPFGATVGGLGLTGLVVEAVLRLTPVATSRVTVDTERAADLDDVLDRMASRDHEYAYSVAWIDLLARGASLGRSVLTRGDFASPADLRDGDDPLAFDPLGPVPAPPWVPPGLLNRATIGAFNEAWFRRAPVERRGELQTVGAFFHPLDAVEGWNRLYGRAGFVQWQGVVPFAATETLREVVGRLSAARVPTFLAVLKRFGPGSDAPLSFPAEGWTLALDVPAGVDGLAGLLDGLDELVVGAGGRLYLAKDGRVRPELVPVMYPRLDEWRHERARLDPEGRFRSDLGRRLGLV